MIEQKCIESRQNGKEYQISVSLPETYDASSDKRYSVVYVLDGNIFFELVVAIARYLGLIDTFPATIIVGIGYPNCHMFGSDSKRSFELCMKRRFMDFTPFKDEAFEEAAFPLFERERRVVSDTGGAGAFWGFVAKELIPQIERDYRITSSNRTLIGHSLGGVFALLTMLRMPEMFTNFIVGSPSFGCCNKLVFKYESDYAKEHKTLSAKTFVGIGEAEEHFGDPFLSSISELYKFSAALLSRNYQGLTYMKRVFEGQDHVTVPPMVFNAGLKNIFL
ncbi:MAG: alpha/beta hydrolase-fold protein [Thermodesulfobacteriota bacterium]|jgi:predicted alpha/beta superfamily hydrolase